METKIDAFIRTFIIVEPDPIVGLDLAGALSSAFPKSSTSLCRMVAEAKAQIKEASDSVCILLSSGLASDDVMSSLRKCVSRGAKVVFVGSIDSIDFPAAFIEVPFSNKMILDAFT